MPESHGKRRRGSQRSRRPDGHTRAAPAPVEGSITSRLPGAPVLILIVAVVLIVGAGFLLIVKPGSGSGPTPSGGTAVGDCPTSQPAPLPAGQTRTVTLNTAKGVMTLKIEADLSPIAAGNFVALASCGWYDGSPFHRTAKLADGTPFVIQGGARNGKDLGYTIEDEKVTTPYKRGTVAMARTSAPNSVGTQFFIVLDDKDGTVLGSANTYQIIGNVTSGMEVADAIFQASGGVELPTNPVIIDTATVANP